MDRRTYVTEGNYSNYNDHEGGYVYEPEQRVKWYVVETTTFERVRGPASGYTKYGGAPLRHEHPKEYMLKYAPKDHHEGYELNYGSSYENSSLPRYKEDHMIRGQNFAGMNKYLPTSPTHSLPSKEGLRIRTQRLSGPNKHRPSSPSPERGRHIRMGKFPGPNMHWHGVGLPTTRHHLTAPTNDINEAVSFLVESVNYSSPAQSYEHERRYTRYLLPGLDNWIWILDLPDFTLGWILFPYPYGMFTVDELVDICGIEMHQKQTHKFLNQTKMAGKTYMMKSYSTNTTIPAQRGGYAVDQTKTLERVRAPAAGYTDFVGSPSKLELLNEYVHSPSVSVSPKYDDYKPKSEDSVYYSPRADPRRRGVLDDLSMRAQPLEPQRRYARPAFVFKPNDARHNFTNKGSTWY
ncbi:hypothetical protein L1987_79413 [Smallanthus sonchifolius]|uniref:Uncharacterized protein n=1 Tax=Smallanthus sonchifolius TaxID=185202 RepID=A0ACB8ZGG2_9ASTR|nr:hypothetical protein L1987_79413 [Smallanthus sonchifolius]